MVETRSLYLTWAWISTYAQSPGLSLFLWGAFGHRAYKNKGSYKNKPISQWFTIFFKTNIISCLLVQRPTNCIFDLVCLPSVFNSNVVWFDSTMVRL